MEKIHSVLSEFFAEFGSVLSSFDSFADVLDVLLVAVIIYALIIQLRKTQSVQIIKGIALLVVVYALVAVFKMQTTKLVFDYLINDLLLIIVIIFSTEIRQALEQMGKSKFKNIFSLPGAKDGDTETNDCINATVRACASMSEDKIGSLMVFQRGSNLGSLERTGVAVDAKVTSEMLCSIFFPNSALHDGAIIISDGRVIAARCIVSLKNNIVVHEKVGTRHRAALEVSRSSDAVVVVTSEETGIISIAIDGVMKRGISKSELRQYLVQYLMPQPAAPAKISSKIKKIFTKGGADNVPEQQISESLESDDGSVDEERADENKNDR